MFRKKRDYITSKVEWYEKITGGDIFIAIFATLAVILVVVGRLL